MNTKLSIYGLSKTYDHQAALDDIHLEIQPGRITGLMGPNGAGKTTLLRAIMGLVKPDAGNIIFNGLPLGTQARAHIAYLPDHNPLLQWMRVRDAMHYYRDMFADYDPEKAQELCDFLQIDVQARVRTLPSGMLQRVLVMLTFARRAQLYLLDEPIGGIDPLARRKILQTILSNMEADRTVLLATHLVNEVETILDDVLFQNQGRILAADSAEAIRAERSQSIHAYYLEVFENA
ncbi:MAG: type transport system ATP-binding protein [Chloroflexota bacterium]|nr:type transport system ATP-binding protein [Chloroflexota bacterium]